MNAADRLMLTGTVAWCPDCDAERILVEVELGEYCCTDCDAAVLLVDVVPMAAMVLSRAAS